jgi:hypothetical protein
MFQKVLTYLRDRGEFPDRIRNRNRVFWSAPDAKQIKITKNTKADPLSKWQDAPNWQRKLSNKGNSREFAELFGARLPALYWKGSDVDQLDFATLPNHYVIRPTIGFGSNQVFIMNNGTNLFDCRRYEPEEIRTILKNMISNREGLEVLVEEFLQNEKGEYGIQTDYKFYCYKGEIACCWVINRESPKSGNGSYYDLNWNKIKMVNTTYPHKFDPIKPKCYEEMIEQARKLSIPYDIFVRIDFYATPKGAVFGEFTPTPCMGKMYTSFGKKLLLDYWDKYCPGKI